MTSGIPSGIRYPFSPLPFNQVADTGPVGTAGITLTEIMVASVISVVILLGLLMLESSRISRTEHLRDDAAVKYPSRQEANLALLHISQRLEGADRYVLINGGEGIQVRRPNMTVNVGTGCLPTISDPICFDDARNYVWDQYSLAPGTRPTSLRFYSNTHAASNPAGNCSSLSTLVRSDVNDLAFSINASTPHIVDVVITWLHPTDTSTETGTTMIFPGRAILRSRSQNLATGLENQAAPSVCP